MPEESLSHPHALEARRQPMTFAEALRRLSPSSRSLRMGRRRHTKLAAILLIETAGLFAIPAAQSSRTAAALECLHPYSHYTAHPAVDDGDMHRGNPPVTLPQLEHAPPSRRRYRPAGKMSIIFFYLQSMPGPFLAEFRPRFFAAQSRWRQDWTCLSDCR
jgi:hypothetical protein